MSKQHLPSIAALTASDDQRLLEELEIRTLLDKLARVRAIVDRADQILLTVLACSENAGDVGPSDAEFREVLLRRLRSMRNR